MIYRAFANEMAANAGPMLPQAGRRPPGNIAYLADNVIEWLRPEEYPSRRQAAFASSTPVAAAATLHPRRAFVYEVTLPVNHLVAHLASCPDARFHPDATSILRCVRNYVSETLPGWFDLPFVERGPLAALFVPCLSGEECSNILESEEFAGLCDKLRNTVRFWNDVEVLSWELIDQNHTGEIFFTVPAQGYGLQPPGPYPAADPA